MLPTSSQLFLHLPTSSYIFLPIPTSSQTFLTISPTSSYIFLHLPTSSYLWHLCVTLRCSTVCVLQMTMCGFPSRSRISFCRYEYPHHYHTNTESNWHHTDSSLPQPTMMSLIPAHEHPNTLTSFTIRSMPSLGGLTAQLIKFNKVQ